MSYFNNVKAITLSGKSVAKLELAGKKIWEAISYKNWVRYSTESDGTTIYNGGLGYKNGYRIRSGGAEGVAATATCTGFIPVQAGDVVRVSGCSFSASSTANAINASDGSFANIGQLVGNFPSSGYGIFANGATYFSYSWNSVVEEKTGVWKWIVPPAESSVAYIRVTGETNDGSEMIVTINEEIV